MRSSTQSRGVPRPPTAARPALCALVMAITSLAAGQNEPYQAYPLGHQRAAEIKPRLLELIRHLQPEPHVLVDDQGNQLLVRGSAQAHGVARQFLDSVDRPAAPPAAAPATELQAIVRGYRVASDQLGASVARLQSRFGNDPRLRLTADPSTSQVIVLAPPELQALIAAELSPPAPGPVQPPPSVAAGGPPAQLQPPPESTRGPAPAARPAQAQPHPGLLNPPAPHRASPPRASLLGQATPGSATPSSGVPPQSAAADQYLNLTQRSVGQVEQQLRQVLGSRLEPRRGGSPGPDLVFVKGRQRAELILDPSRNGIRVAGDQPLVAQLAQLIRALDRSERQAAEAEPTIRIIPVHGADPKKVQEAVDAYRRGSALPPLDPQGRSSNPREIPQQSAHGSRLRLPVVLAQHTELAAAEQPPPVPPPPGGDILEPVLEQPPAPGEQEALEQRLRQLGETVQIETLPDLDVIILRGRDPDVDEVARIIAEIERLSAETVPMIDIYRLRHVHCMSIVTIIDLVAQDLIGGRQGKIHLTPLVKPNALLLVGWGEAIEAMRELIAKLDQPVSPESQLRVYRLRHASVSSAAGVLQNAFANPQGLGPRVELVPDLRTNSLIVRAAPRDMGEVDLLISRLDQGTSGYVSQARLFKLQNTLATDLAATLQDAIAAAAGAPGENRSAVLELLTADVQGQKLLRSGVLNDVQITADPHTNTLVVTAPAESMELLAALIQQLDSPSGVAQIKVFRIVNGDATSLIEMLRSLLPAEMRIAGPQLAGAEGESTLVPVRFSVDLRTNSIIATGSEGDLAIIEALLMRLDEEDVEQRINSVYRLKNAPALDVAVAVNEFLRSERLVQQATPGLLSPFEQIEREVVVVPEPVSNALIVSATPRFFEEIMQVVESLDEQPPQVMIQVVIAEVRLANIDEFGIELGLQDSVLFDRSAIVNNILMPGYNFNNQPLGNSTRNLQDSNIVGTQGLSNFALGRTNPQLGYGGLVLSASSESVSVLIRALRQTRRLEVLGRPQIMTLDNQAAFIQVGERVPRITGSRFDGRVQTNSIELENTGLILGVTPRISPEGMVVMEIDAERSRVGPEAEGIPVSVVETSVIRSPKIEVTTAQTTVSAANGETIVMGGLITKSTDVVQRRVPYLSDIPLLGLLFRYDSEECLRTELLIFLTPHVVRNRADMERIKQLEAARMNWCLADVHAIHGPLGLLEEAEAACWAGAGEVIYPDRQPFGLQPGEFAPTPLPMDQLPPRLDQLQLSPRLEELPAPGERSLRQ